MLMAERKKKRGMEIQRGRVGKTLGVKVTIALDPHSPLSGTKKEIISETKFFKDLQKMLKYPSV